MRWTPEYVRQRFPAEVRELRRAEGESLNIKPTHKWLREHGFSGIQGYAERNEKTVDDVLLEECGFDQREKKAASWNPCGNEGAHSPVAPRRG